LLVEASVANTTELVWVHSSFFRNCIDFSHGLCFQAFGAAVDKSAIIRILTRFAVVVDELELGLTWFIFSNYIPIFPKFYAMNNIQIQIVRSYKHIREDHTNHITKTYLAQTFLPPNELFWNN
jgi:hypothetical protein